MWIDYLLKSIKVQLLHVIPQDISDLFGSDLPVEGGKGVKFEWRDGPFLKALKCGEWILLDEARSFT